MTAWSFTYWVGHFDGTPVMFAKRLLSWGGRCIELHRIVDADMPACFHTHPASAIRIVLWGGYVEELPDGTRRIWRPGMIGVVRPDYAHRIDALRTGGASWSLWLRGRKTARTRLIGKGWGEKEGAFV